MLDIKIKGLSYTNKFEEYPKCVTVVEYDITKEHEGDSLTITNSQNLVLDVDKDYVQFEQLTEELVLEWLQIDTQLLDELMIHKIVKSKQPEDVFIQNPFNGG